MRMKINAYCRFDIITDLSKNLIELGYIFFVPRLFKEKRRDTVFGFPWCVARGSDFLVGTLSP